MTLFDIVVAMDSRRGIGRAGVLPWHIPSDLGHFKALTAEAPKGQENAVIMGRKTWESLPDRFRPLPGRFNIVISQNPSYFLPFGVRLAPSLEAALDLAKAESHVAKAFVIGGADIIGQALVFPNCKTIHLTQVQSDADCDVFLPDFSNAFVRTQVEPTRSENGWTFHFETWKRDR